MLRFVGVFAGVICLCEATLLTEDTHKRMSDGCDDEFVKDISGLFATNDEKLFGLVRKKSKKSDVKGLQAVLNIIGTLGEATSEQFEEDWQLVKDTTGLETLYEACESWKQIL